MDKLEDLERRVPIASDKALIDLVNGIQVNHDLIRYRKSRGFFGQIFDELTGIDKERQILLDGNLIDGQQALYQWVLELTDSLKISQTALEITQNSLLEARAAIRKNKQSLSARQQDLSFLDGKLDRLTHEFRERIDHLEERVNRLELKFAAREDFDRIVTAWEAHQTYTNLPWPIRVFMLIREVFSSAVGIYELETGDTTTYRQLLIHKIISIIKPFPTTFFSLSDLLERTWQDSQSSSDLELSLGIFEIRSLPQWRIQRLPFQFALATTLELATLPEDIKPNRPGRCAVELCRHQVERISYTTDVKELVVQVTNETASDRRLSMACNREKWK